MQIDNDGSKTIDLSELLHFYGHLMLPTSELRNLLTLCGYKEEAVYLILGRAGLLSGSSFSDISSHSSQRQVLLFSDISDIAVLRCRKSRVLASRWIAAAHFS